MSEARKLRWDELQSDIEMLLPHLSPSEYKVLAQTYDETRRRIIKGEASRIGTAVSLGGISFTPRT